MKVPKIELGAGKNRVSISPSRAAISHTRISPIGDAMEITRSRIRSLSNTARQAAGIGARRTLVLIF